MRHAKIVCTLGPASSSLEIIEQLIVEGMEVARLNFSHGNHEEHGGRIAALREACRRRGKLVSILLDTKGPEIRIGDLKEGKMSLEAGQRLVLTTRPEVGEKGRVGISYSGLPGEVKPGDLVLVDDGMIGLEVESVNGEDIACRVKNGGQLLPYKGLNLPGLEVALPAVTEKDVADIAFGISQQVDFIAASFIRSAADVHQVRRVLEKNGAAHIQVIAKIESRSGVNNLEEILKVADGIMVARGDLGVEIPPEEVPLIQKTIIKKCNREGKPVITATQMLDSMIRNPRPTRAEASDVANAVLDGTDAIMLAGETAAGKYPVEAVRTAARIILKAEEGLDYGGANWATRKDGTTTDAIAHATCTIALELGAAAIITPTTSGSTARMVAKYRPRVPIVATCPDRRVLQQLSLVWGVQALGVEKTGGTDEVIEAAVSATLNSGMIASGELVVVTAGVPVGQPGTTNLIKVHVVAEVLAKGTGIGRQVRSGVVRLARSGAEAARIEEGEVLVAPSTDREFVPAMQKAAAVITGEGGLTSHAAIVCLNLDIPAVVGVDKALESLREGQTVTVDGRRGLIYSGVTRVL